MKKIVSFLLILVALSSCETDVKFSDPGFQGRKDNFVWRADVSSATIAAGTLTINAYRGLESVTLSVPAPTTTITKFNPVTFNLATADDTSFATYRYEDEGFGFDYATGYDDVKNEAIGNGQILINELDFVKGRVSGQFKFNAKYDGESTIAAENVNYQEGVFYHVPLQ